MLRRFLVAAGVLLTVLGLGTPALAATEVIEAFDANLALQSNGTVTVTESIQYNFDSNQKHGIYRDIPLTAADGPQLYIDVLGVTDANGRSYEYTTSTASNSLRIKIGDPDVLVSGVKTYVISYEVNNAIRVFEDHDELYWNVTGNEWPVNISRASASVLLPDPAITNAQTACFTGAAGAKDAACAFSQSGQSVNFVTTQPLKSNEGLTLVLGVPAGYIHSTFVPPSTPEYSHPVSYGLTSEEEFWLELVTGVAVIGSFLVFIITLVIIGRRKKTKPKPRIPKELRGQPVVVEYGPPDNLPPIEIGTLLDRRVDVTDISSIMLDLAVKGYLKIRYTVQVIKFWPDKKDFELIKLKEGTDLVHPADKIIFALLFNGRNTVKLSDLTKQKLTFQAELKKLKTETEDHLHTEGYFDEAARERAKKLSTYFGIGLALILFGSFISGFVSEVIGPIIYWTAIIGVIIGSFTLAGLSNVLTPKGVATMAKILGFKEFLDLTEKDKLGLMNAPELEPEMFEKFLPYAMVLGIEDKWAAKFEGIYNTVPDWYDDPTATTFNSFVLTRNLGLFNTSFNQVVNITAPRSHSSGFSSGGGFSGGGSGGGGGGSW